MSNAVVNTFAAGTAKLVNLPVLIAAPQPKDLTQFGGVIHHVVLFNPTDDVRAGDSLVIVSWGPFTPDGRTLHIYSAEPSGGLGLEVIRALVGEKVQR